MTFKELIDAITTPLDGSDYLEFYSYWFNSPNAGRIPYEEITDDTPVKIIYYWDSLGIPETECSQIKTAIKNHDFRTYRAIKEKLYSLDLIDEVNLPNVAEVCFPTILKMSQPETVRGHIEGCWGCRLNIIDSNFFNLIEEEKDNNNP